MCVLAVFGQVWGRQPFLNQFEVESSLKIESHIRKVDENFPKNLDLIID